MSGFFYQAYKDALADLSSPELPKIKLLRDLAKENLQEGPNVVAALEHHIKNCPAAQRLPALYLIDCIIKTVKEPFAALFSPVIAELIGFVWDHAGRDLRPKLTKTAGTWKEHLSEDTMKAVNVRMATPLPAAPAPAPAPVPVAPAQFGTLQPAALLQPAVGVYGVQAQPTYLAAAPMYAAAPQVSYAYPQPALAPAVPVAPAWGYAPPMPAPMMPPSQYPAPAAQAAVAAPTASQMPLFMSSLLELNNQLRTASRPARRELTSQALKGHDPEAVNVLKSDSEATRPSLFHARYLRKRRLDNTAHPVRPWYTTVDQWLQGTRPDTDVSISFFEDEANAGADEAGAKAAAQLEPVEEDPSQPTCAISGEPFERSYDPDTDKWYYDDAVVLRGEQAARYGVMEGSIVKATCLAGAPPPQAAKAGAGAVVQGGASVQAGAAAAQQEQSLAGGVAGTGVLPEKRSSHGEEGGPEQKRPRTTP